MFAFSDSVRIFQQEGHIRTQHDPEQPINRLNASYFSHFQAKGNSLGHSLKFVASGKEQYQVDQDYHQVQPGQFLLVPHESPVEISISSASKVTRGFCLYFSPELISDIQAHLSQGPEDRLDHKPGRATDPWLSGRFESRHHAIHQQLTNWYQHFHEYGFSQEAFWDMAEVIVRFQREAQGQLTRISARKSSTAQELLHRLHMGQAFIHDSYTRKISIHDMAEVACLSPFHFTRTFKAAFGKSPYQYVQFLRIQKALELLRNLTGASPRSPTPVDTLIFISLARPSNNERASRRLPIQTFAGIDKLKKGSANSFEKKDHDPNCFHLPPSAKYCLCFCTASFPAWHVGGRSSSPDRRTGQSLWAGFT